MAKVVSKSKSSFNGGKAVHAPRRWQLQDAKAKFSKMVKDSQTAPQIITVHGEEVAVVQSIDQYRKLHAKAGKQIHWLDELLKCPPGPDLVIDRDPSDIVGSGMPNIFD